MMKARWLWCWICVILGLVMLVCGLLVPMHLRAVDAGVLASAGRSGPGLFEQGQTLASERKLGAAQMLMQAARQSGIPGWDRLGDTITNVARQYPAAVAWGDDARLENLFGNRFRSANDNVPFTDFIVRTKNRKAALAHLRESSISAVQELLHTRSLNNTVLFPPSSSASGQAFDTAVCIGGLLMDENRLTQTLSREIFNQAAKANRGLPRGVAQITPRGEPHGVPTDSSTPAGNGAYSTGQGSEPLEQTLMDFLSLGRRFNWNQLTAFVAEIPDTATLHQLTAEADTAKGKLPVLFAAVQLSGKPAAVARYLAKYPETGLTDLAASLNYGAGGVSELAQSRQRFYNPAFERRVTEYNPFGAFFDYAANVCYQKPWLALAGKWFLYLLAGFLLAMAVHFARPAVSALERPLQVRGFHLLREFLFSLAFLPVVLLLSEPFLAQESQKGHFSLRLHLPMTGGVVAAGIAGLKHSVMNPTILLTMSIFFVLQALLYVASLVKLAEIRRQQVPPRMKLKLLENEDHLFDAGLYLGFVGTIVSLIIASLGLVHFSLMAAYSCTSFGIIFVVVFKIFNLRPTRRKLLLEAEMHEATTTPPAATPPAAAAPATA